jgi:hypothetical protein
VREQIHRHHELRPLTLRRLRRIAPPCLAALQAVGLDSAEACLATTDAARAGILRLEPVRPVQRPEDPRPRLAQRYRPRPHVRTVSDLGELLAPAPAPALVLHATVDLNNPLVKPGAGSDWSFEKWLRANVSGGTYSQITNLKAYTDGSSGLGTGVNVWWKAVTAYATPAQGSSSTGYANAFTYTSGAALSLGAGPFTSTGEKGDHLVMLCSIFICMKQKTYISIKLIKN